MVCPYLIQLVGSTSIGALIDSIGAQAGFILMGVLMFIGLVGYWLISSHPKYVDKGIIKE
ncbi:hypothetical protein OfM1_16110 [Lactovum odontotermitis]